MAPPTIAALSKRIKKLSGSGGHTPLGPGWWDDFEGFALLRDPSWRPYCTLDQFVVGRAALVARWWQLLDSFAYWQKHQDPYWWTLEAWQKKTPDFQEQIDRDRRLHCPVENRVSMAKFVDWFYGDAPRREGEQPQRWCQPDVGSLYYWPDWRFHQMGLLPLAHGMLIASATWLIDGLGLKPAEVRAAASAHYCAYRWNDFSRLAQVHLPDRPITSDSPKLFLKQRAAWCEAHSLLVSEERVNVGQTGDDLELLELLMCVPSGCGGEHRRELVFPSIASPFR